MTRSKRRKENEAKIRKQTPQPHGHITSLEEFADEYEAARNQQPENEQQS